MLKSGTSRGTDPRLGYSYGLAAYVMWGLFPLYWGLLKPAGAFEILGHRILWSLVTMIPLVFVMRRRAQFVSILRTPAARWPLVAAALVITFNWATYIWGVNNGRVVETALGYFINPLLTVVLGVFLFGERLRRLQWAALSLAAAAIVVLTVAYGRLPWVALVLACSFGTYGLLKKQANVGGVESLAFETMISAPLAAAFLLWLGLQGRAEFGQNGVTHMALLAFTGVITAIPLICFGEAATRISLLALGLMQYLAPTIQFFLGIWWFQEPMPTSRLVGFGLVWLALILFTAESIKHRRDQLKAELIAPTTCT